LEYSPRSIQSAVHGAFLASQLDCGFPAALAFQDAKHECLAKGPGQMLDLLIQDGLNIVPSRANRTSARTLRRPCLVFPPTSGASLKFHGCAVRHSVQPFTDRIPCTDHAHVAGEDKKRYLKCIFGILFVVQHAATDPQCHRTVPRDKRGEGSLASRCASAFVETFEQLSIREGDGRPSVEK
jgi:hypothetical protein